MTDIDEARKRLEAVLPRLAWFREQVLVADIRTVLDALDAAERERDEALAVIERQGRFLEAAPGDALRVVKADAWFDGYDKGNLDGYFGTRDERARSPYADLDPHRENGSAS